MIVNWLDLAIGGILLLSLIGAVRNGVTKEIVRIAALIFGVLGGMWFYERAALELTPYISNGQLARFAAFVSIVIGCLIAGGVLSWILAKLWGLAGLRWFDRLLGAGFGLVRGLVIATAVVLGVVAFSPFAGTAETVAGSRFAPLVLHGARAAAFLAPSDMKTAYDQGFERVRATWSGAAPAETAANETERASPLP